MTMRRILLAAAALAAFGCSNLHHDTNPYDKTLFYQKYLSPATSPLDAEIQHHLDQLRENPGSATLHNELGAMLLQKGFPKDAEREFERAVNADSHFYPGWYNLGLVRAAQGDNRGATHAFHRTVHYKPGHSFALFQLGLIEERAGHDNAAVSYYAKAIGINHSLLDVRINPRVVDSRLMARALISGYAREHSRESMSFQGMPMGSRATNAAAAAATAATSTPAAPSPQAPAQNIVTPSAPVTDPAMQHPAPSTPPPAAPGVPIPPPSSSTSSRPQQPVTQPAVTQAPGSTQPMDMPPVPTDGTQPRRKGVAPKPTPAPPSEQ
jgi:tetratricopeptide (TPR) repeat protein